MTTQPNLCENCKKPRCSTPCPTSSVEDESVLCHGCSPKPCGTCGGSRSVWKSKGLWRHPEQGDRKFEHGFVEVPCPSCHPVEKKGCDLCWRGICSAHQPSPSPSESWEAEFEAYYGKYLRNAGKESGHRLIDEDIKSFIRSILRKQHQEVLKKAKEKVVAVRGKYQRYLKDAKIRSDAVDMSEYAWKELACDEALSAIESVKDEYLKGI